MSLRRFLRGCTKPNLLPCALLVTSLPAFAGTIGISYTLSGTPTITGITATTVDLSGTNTGSFDQANPAANALWNPVSFTYASQADIASGLLTGTFSMTLADGDTLSGTVNEDLSAILSSPTLTGSYTQVLTFTGGTGEFAGASGSASGTGYESVSGGTASGTGALTISAVAAPEPASLELMLSGVGLLAAAYRRRRTRRAAI